MDPESQQLVARGSRSTSGLDTGDLAQHARGSSFGQGVLVFFLVLLVLGVLPASMIIWVCLSLLVFTCMRVRLQAQRLHAAIEEQDQLAHPVGHRSQRRLPLGRGAPVIRLLPGGGLVLLHGDPHAALSQIDTHLRHLDEEVDIADYEALAHLAAHGQHAPARPQPVSDVDLATLPCYPYKLPRSAVVAAAAAAAAAPAPGAAQAAPASSALMGPEGAAKGLAAVLSGAVPSVSSAAGAGPALGPVLGRARSSSGSGAAGGDAAAAAPALRELQGSGGAGGGGGCGLGCSICLETVEEGQMVMTLPCMHQFHAACITPWLRRQGATSSCPMCKTPVFP